MCPQIYQIYRQTSKPLAWLVNSAVGLALLMLGAQQGGYAMGWFEKKPSGAEIDAKLRRAMPLIKQRADQTLVQLARDPTKLVFDIVADGEGEEVWTVKYWAKPPQDYVAQVTRHAELEVYLNNHGVVRRVVKFENGQEELLYGKDERIKDGMTPEQVRERLGEPDYKGPPIRELRDKFDEVWKYKPNTIRTMRIEVLFKDGKVSGGADYFGE